MGRIEDSLREVLSTLPEGVELCAVSKFHPEEELLAAYSCGQRIFGESHVQELQRKQAALPKDIQWHFIGHLQTNKVKYIAPYVALIHSADSLRLLQEVNRQALKCGRVIDVLLEVHVAQEETKSGFSFDELRELLSSGALAELSGVRARGLMTMASFVDDEAQIASEFHRAHSLFLELKERYFAADPSFSICSWGMSDDYPIAISHGSTIVRVGTKIFGPRVY